MVGRVVGAAPVHTVPYRLVTVVAERIVRDAVLEAVYRLGATGHTLTDVGGSGSRGVHASSWEGASVKVEVIVPPDVAERIAAHVAEAYFAHHAVIVYLQDVEVLRGSKYGPTADPTGRPAG